MNTKLIEDQLNRAEKAVNNLQVELATAPNDTAQKVKQRLENAESDVRYWQGMLGVDFG